MHVCVSSSFSFFSLCFSSSSFSVFFFFFFFFFLPHFFSYDDNDDDNGDEGDYDDPITEWKLCCWEEPSLSIMREVCERYWCDSGVVVSKFILIAFVVGTAADNDNDDDSDDDDDD